MENNENNFTNNTTNNEEEKLRMEGTQKKKGNPIGIIAIILLIEPCFSPDCINILLISLPDSNSSITEFSYAASS